MLKDYSNKVMDYEYNLFMTLMNVSVSKHLFDEHFTVLWANDYFYQLIGYEKEEYEALFHNHVDEYYRDDPKSVAQMAEVIMAAYESKERGYELECPMRVKGGGNKWIRVTGRFTDEFYNEIPVIYTIYTDITDLKDLQLQLSDALEAAQKANRSKSEFLSRMSHDIRTPMNAIMGMTEIAADHIDEPKRIQDCLKKIALSSQHLLGLINDVLDMSKIESGKMTFNSEALSLSGVLENVVAIMQPDIQRREQKFDVRLHGVRHEKLYGDALRLRQILINILSNASKFTPDGGSIIFEAEEMPAIEEEAAQFCFTITDTGIGMRPEFKEHIFDTFTREQDSRVDKTEGSGLGMAITKKLVDMMQGSIEVDSADGAGTTFRVTLSFRIDEEQEEFPSLEKLKVMVVDDDAVACEYLVHSLQELGAAADACESGCEAVERMLRAKEEGKGYDIAILDWKMPGMDAIQTTKALRERIGWDFPVVVTSAYDWGDVEEEALQIGVNGFIQKPLFKSSLSYELRRCLTGSSLKTLREKKIDFSGRRFLLAEDNALNQEIAVELLSSSGAVMETADNGRICLEKFKMSPENYYALILMDIQMPVMNGYDSCRAIRALPRADAARIPILAMTADAFAEDVDAALEAGMNGHLAKPLDRLKMEREINKWL